MLATCWVVGWGVMYSTMWWVICGICGKWTIYGGNCGGILLVIFIKCNLCWIFFTYCKRVMLLLTTSCICAHDVVFVHIKWDIVILLFSHANVKLSTISMRISMFSACHILLAVATCIFLNKIFVRELLTKIVEYFINC